MDTLSGAIGLLAGAISYMLGVCAPLGPEEMTLPTPCADWDLAMLLGHLCESMADLETALRTGRLDLEDRPARPEAIRSRRSATGPPSCCAPVYCYGGPERFVAVGGLPMPAGVVACTGAVEIAVHGWDVSAARCPGWPRRRAGGDGDVREARSRPRSPPGCSGWARCSWPAGEGLFAVPVEVPAQASPGDRLVGYLGRGTRVAAAIGYWRVI